MTSPAPLLLRRPSQPPRFSRFCPQPPRFFVFLNVDFANAASVRPNLTSSPAPLLRHRRFFTSHIISFAQVLKTGAVSAAAGSAYAEFGNTKVIVSVYGPRESKKAMYSDVGRLNCNVSYTAFATPSRGQGSDHKEYSSMLHQSLEGAIMLDSFPKTIVDVFALVLESGGSDLPVIISCASLALADVGIMMYDLVASVSMSSSGPNLIIDHVSEEESNQDGSLIFTCMTTRNDVTQLIVTEEWSTLKMNEFDMDNGSQILEPDFEF